MLHRIRKAGAWPTGTALPFTRMFIIALIMTAFAIGFSNLAKRTDSVEPPESSALTCGEATGVACPTKRSM